MRKLTPVELAAWTLPLIAVAISAPVIAAFALAGPAAGMAAGALVAGAILVIAARTRFEEEMEVAPARAEGGGILVVAIAAVEGEAVDSIARASRDPATQGEAGAPVLVLAPALNSRLSHWLSDLRAARLDAQERLAVSLAVLATAGVDARGQVGDTDPVQATEDALRSFPAREVIFVTPQRRGAAAVTMVRRRLDRPVRHVVSGEPAAEERSPQGARR